MPLPKVEHQLYCDLMDEARERINALGKAIDNRKDWIPRLLQEFAYLQLRILCEIIAMGCLVAHGDMTRKGVRKIWKPAEIIQRMEALNKRFYPRGVRMTVPSTGVTKIDDYDAPQLSKNELVTLWALTGSFLHRGNAKNLLSELGKVIAVDLDPIIQSGQKMRNLLEQHVISSADNKQHLIVALSSPDHDGRALVGYAESPP